MNLLSKNYIIFIHLLVSIFSSSIYSNENDWGLEITLTKQVYMSHEPIWLDILLTNNRSDTVRTHGLELVNHRQFIIDIIDSNGELIEYTGGVSALLDLPGQLLLEEGEQDFGSFNLPPSFAQRGANSGYEVPYQYFPYILKGTYTVQARFEGSSSKELSFTVVEPSGQEIEALELIEKATSLWRQDDADPSSQVYQEVVDRFPNSPYAEMSLFLSLSYSHKIWDKRRNGTYGNFEDAVFKKEMIKNYPNSGDAITWLDAITYDLDDELKMGIFNQFIKDHPNTRSARFAKQKHQRILKTRNAKKGE